MKNLIFRLNLPGYRDPLIFAGNRHMLSQQEQDFVSYWEAHREVEGRWTRQLLRGLPLGMCFGLPILVCFIFRSWYKWLPFVTSEELVVILIAVVGIVLFYAVFQAQHRWEMREQHYLELKAKDKKTDIR